MKVLRLKPPVARIAHPNDPEVAVHVERPSRAELLAYQEHLSDQEETIVLVNPATKAAVILPSGKVATEKISHVKSNSMIEFFAKYIKRVEGVRDETGEVLETGPKVLAALLEPEFDCTVPVLDAGGFPKVKQQARMKAGAPELDEKGEPIMDDVIENGQPVMETSEQNYYTYLLREIGKPETWTDPLGSSSASRRTDA